MGGRLRVDFEQLAAAGDSLESTAGRVSASTRAFRRSGGGLGFAGGAYAHVAERILDGVERLAVRVEEGFTRVIRAHATVARRITDRLQADDGRLAAEARAETAHERRGPPRPRPPQIPAGPADPEKPHPHDPMDLIPAGAREKPFGPNSKFEHGRDYRWKDAQGRKIRLHVHTADPDAPAGSASRNGPVYRVQIDDHYLDAAGRTYALDAGKQTSPGFVRAFATATHIPWPADIPLPWSRS
jgi:hypothetical protein